MGNRWSRGVTEEHKAVVWKDLAGQSDRDTGKKTNGVRD